MKNYAKWSMVKHYISLMGQDFLDAYYTFTSAVTGNGERERYLTCVSLVENSLPMAVARPFADKFFTNSSRQEVSCQCTILYQYTMLYQCTVLHVSALECQIS